MASEKKSINPFYLMLGIMGFVFTITAVLFTLVMLRDERGVWQQMAPENANQERQVLPPENPLLKLIREDGTRVFIWEIGIIAVLTVGGIGLDRYRDLKNMPSETVEN